MPMMWSSIGLPCEYPKKSWLSLMCAVPVDYVFVNSGVEIKDEGRKYIKHNGK